MSAKTGNGLWVRRSLKTKDILHGIEAGALLDSPASGPQGTGGEDLAVGRSLGELDPFSFAGEPYEVIAHDVAPAEGMGTDLGGGTLARETLAAVGDVGVGQAA